MTIIETRLMSEGYLFEIHDTLKTIFGQKYIWFTRIWKDGGKKFLLVVSFVL